MSVFPSDCTAQFLYSTTLDPLKDVVWSQLDMTDGSDVSTSVKPTLQPDTYIRLDRASSQGPCTAVLTLREEPGRVFGKHPVGQNIYLKVNILGDKTKYVH